MHEKEPTAVLIVIFLAIGVLAFFVFIVMGRLQALQEEVATNSTFAVDVSGWVTYRNDTYGFELEYPPQWQVSTDGLTSDTPFVAFGNPLEGQKTYALDVFVENNTSSLSSGTYVHTFLAAARAQDAENAKSGPAPQIAPSFEKTYVLTTGGYPAYELYKVFEFDHNAEKIYVAHGSDVLRFDFPVANENPNIFLPVANNGIAHGIINTLIFTK